MCCIGFSRLARLKGAMIRCVLLTVLVTTVLSNVIIRAPDDVVAGRPFTLECKVTRPTNATSYLIWSHAAARIYVSFNCTSSIPVSPSPAGLSGGCQHANGEEVYTVTIENVTEDAGRGSWRCQYGTGSDSVTLDVKVMVTRVTVTNPPGIVLAGDPSNFTCVASASKPHSCIMGYIRGSSNIREVDHPTDCNQASSSVQITTRTLTFTASAEENGAELYCNASNSVTDPPVRSLVYTLNVHYPPQNGLLLLGHVNNTVVESGETLALTCQVGKGNPRPALFWSLGCGQTNTVPGNDGQQINISITVSPSLNQKTCVCKGSQDGALTRWMEQDSKTFNVTFGPDSVQLLAESGQSGNTVTVTENSTVTFTCTSGESNPAAVLSWYNNSSPIAAAELSDVSSQRGPNHGYLTTQRYTVRADRYQDGDVIRCEAQRPLNEGSNRVSPNLTLDVSSSVASTSNRDALIAPLAGGISGAVVLLGLVLTGVVILLRRRSGMRSGEKEHVSPDDISSGGQPARHYENIGGIRSSAKEHTTGSSSNDTAGNDDADLLPGSPTSGSGVPAELYAVVDKKKKGPPVKAQVNKPPKAPKPAKGQAGPVYTEVNKAKKTNEIAKAPEGPEYSEVNKTEKKANEKTGLFGKAKVMFHLKPKKPERHRVVDTYANAAFDEYEVMHSKSGDRENPSRPSQRGGSRKLAYTDVDFMGTKPSVRTARYPSSYASIAFGQVGPTVQADTDDERDGHP